ncbi:cell surface protein/ lipoprotein [Methylophaga lonarensis MPL]|uniref:Cell surface protein/ lipoprotein n=1 Tax=Methylophaga lonarensis MPL TaxID=1286106 RepID=M7PF29_9GAMM|nr:PQQ-binding-like beta-propeller repeat protein [Methylophaga lonarensis]EMR12510.1 cell surface protein/ lipoprotein [Methylophaga lonarensis MPL]
MHKVFGLLCVLLLSGLAGCHQSSSNGEASLFRGDLFRTGYFVSHGPVQLDKQALVWRFEGDQGLASSPVVNAGVVFAGAYEGDVYAIDARSGDLLWQFATGAGVFASPAVTATSVYIGSDDSFVYALDISTGAQRWRYKTNDKVFSSPLVYGGTVYVGSLMAICMH